MWRCYSLLPSKSVLIFYGFAMQNSCNFNACVKLQLEVNKWWVHNCNWCVIWSMYLYFFLQGFLGWLILQLLSSYLKVLAFSLIQRKKRHRQSFTDWFLKSLLQERVPFPLSCRYPGDWLLSHPCQIRTGLGLFVLFLIWHSCIRQQMHAFCRFDSVIAGLLSMLPEQVPHLLSQLPEQSSWDLQ